MSQWKRFSLFLAPVVFFALLPIVASAQDNMGMGSKQSMSVTGCLKQGSDMHGYYLMGQDGKMYELWGKGLGEHVGHTVTVTGMEEKMSASEEAKKETSEKTEAGGASVMDMKVSSVKMVSTSCK
jgi:hypothetical protein